MCLDSCDGPGTSAHRRLDPPNVQQKPRRQRDVRPGRPTTADDSRHRPVLGPITLTGSAPWSSTRGAESNEVNAEDAARPDDRRCSRGAELPCSWRSGWSSTAETGSSSGGRRRTRPTSHPWPAPGGSRSGSGGPVNGRDANVVAVDQLTIAVDGGIPVTFGTGRPEVRQPTAGRASGTLEPARSRRAGRASRSAQPETGKPYFLRPFGITDWTATAPPQPRAEGISAAPPRGPSSRWESPWPSFRPSPPARARRRRDRRPCHPEQLTPGNLNVPGGLGWLKFGCMAGFGLGTATPGRRRREAVLLKAQIGPLQQLRLLHAAGRQPGARQDRQPARQQGQRRLRLLHRQPNDRHGPDLGNGGRHWIERLVPRRRLRRLRDHGLLRLQERRRRVAAALLPRAHHRQLTW